MKHIYSLWDLKKQTSKYVYVTGVNRVFVREGEDYIEKRYFTRQEAQEILKLTRDQMYDRIQKYGLQPKARKGHKLRFKIEDIKKLA